MRSIPRPLWIDDRAPFSVTEKLLLVGIWIVFDVLAFLLLYQVFTFCYGLLTEMWQALLAP